MANLVSNIDGVLEIWDDGTVNIVGGKLQIDSSDVLNNNNNALFSNVRVGTLDFGDASPTLSDNGNYLRIQTSTGYTDIGSNNTSFSHFYTDRNAFYFDKRIQVNSGQVRSHDEDLNLNRAGSTTARLRLTSGTTISDQDFSVTGDVTISGDLTVSGDTVTLNTTTITAEDAVILLNSGQTTPANDIGLIFQRYSTATSANYNPVILWEESSDKFVLGSTTEAATDADIGLDQQWLVVTGDGNVGIGSNAPELGLVVSNGSIPTIFVGKVGDTNHHANMIINRGSTSYDANLLYRTGNVTKWRIWLDGIDNTLQVRDEANASNIMTWETGGNVGINVDDPNAILHIKDGTNPGTAQWDYRVTADFQANNGNTSHLELIQIRDSGGVNDWTRTGTRLQQRIDTTYMGYMQFNGFSNNYGISWGSGGGTAGPEATTEKMCLDQDGNLGIGTTNPSEKLHVEGNIAVTGTVDGRDIATDGTKLDGIETGATADQTAAQILTAIKTVDGSSSGLDADNLDGVTWGNINTTLQTSTNIKAYNGTTEIKSDGIYFESGTHCITWNDGKGNFNVRVGHDVSENVTETGYASHIEWSQSSGWMEISGTTSSRSVGNAITWSNENVWEFSFSDGQFSSPGDVVAYSSDRRLKTNITNIDNALDKVLKLNGVHFDWADDIHERGFHGAKPGEKAVGVIAQEVEAVLPELVAPAPFDVLKDQETGEHIGSKSGEDYKTVKYEKLTALLIEAVKELSAKVDLQQEEIDRLKRQ